MPTIDNGKPVLIRGYDLIAYLRGQNTKYKCATEFDQLFCMKCQDARYVLQRKIIIEQATAVLRVSGQCRVCKSVMYQSYKKADLSRLHKTFRVVGVLELYDCEVPSDKTHIEASIENTINESDQLRLF
ncbi:MAG: hypothetical protein COA45_04185 [Zetaproteobacteria bacterium]|nr:MAG: hypothetical protein COA45_04185 [Zetaproteobacteria bacterium]